MGVLAAIFLASSTGFGVYQSCTKWTYIRRAALVIDVIGAAGQITLYHFWLGVL